jgi:methyl-accepting chemotaxis protein
LRTLARLVDAIVHPLPTPMARLFRRRVEVTSAMLNRITVNVLLKSVIVTLALVVVAMSSWAAWSSWKRLASARRIATVIEASADMFAALPGLRNDRSMTQQHLASDQPLTGMSPPLTAARKLDLPNLQSALAVLETAEFPEQQSAVTNLRAEVDRLSKLQQETEAAIKLPKAERPAGLSDTFVKTTVGLLALLDTTSMQLNRSVRLEDPYIDQILELKQLAWAARNAGGDCSLMISNALGGIPLPPDAKLIYANNLGRIDTAWSALLEIASGLPLPARFTAAVDKAKQEFLGADYMALRTKLLNALADGQPVDVKYADWTPASIAKLNSILAIADAALDVAKEHTATRQADAMWSLLLSLGLLATAFVVVFGMLLVVSRRVTSPLRQIQQAMLKLAGGDFSVVLPGLDRKDEIGDVANAIERFKVLVDEKARAEAAEALQRQKVEADRQAELAQAEAATQAKVAAERARMSEEQTRAVTALGVGLQKLSAGDLTFRLTEAFPHAYQELKENFNGTMTQLQDTIRSLTESAREVSSASAEISASTTDLSQRTEEQAAGLEQTSASMEEIAATVRKNAENAQQANASAGGTQTVAERGGEVVAKAVEAMARIEESSGKIADIIGVIDEIARQTNLLALNAAVEAARAGEAGRGFAVVAAEVRTLAQRSSQAAKDIKDLITSSSGQVKEGVNLVNRAGTSLTEIVESIKKVATIVAEIANASAEQAGGIEQINKALNQMDEVVQQNSALVEENAATAKTLEHQAQAMNGRVATFQVDAAAAIAA